MSKFAKLASKRSTESPSYPEPAPSSSPPAAVSAHVAEPARAAPKAAPVRAAPAAPRTALPVAPMHDGENVKVQFASYMALGDDARLKLLMRKTGKNKVRLLAEALALLFAKNEAVMNEPD